MSAKASAIRARAPNFTREDQELLLEVLKPYLHIIECKKTDNIKLIQKTEAWSKVCLAYNANTKNVPRSVDNLISCYRNMKSKLKKQHSEAKMNLRDPNEKEEFVDAIALNGEDWDAVAKTINKPIEVCKAGFTELKKEFKKHEVEHKKQVLGTGGGPPPDSENPLNKLKPILADQVDGMYTVYDGDADLMKAFQETLPEEERILPIESIKVANQSEGDVKVIAEFEVDQIPSTPMTPVSSQVRPLINRQEILKKKRDPVLISSSKNDKVSKKSCNDSFKALAEEKTELALLHKELVSMKIKHKTDLQESELEVMRMKRKLQEFELENMEHKRKLQEFELEEIEHKRKLQKSELEDLKHREKLRKLELEDVENENKFKAEMRQKKTHVIGLIQNIKKYSLIYCDRLYLQ